MNKKINFIIPGFCLLLSSCGLQDYEMIDEDELVLINGEDITNKFEYEYMYFFEYRDYDYTMTHFRDEEKERIQKSKHKTATKSAFEKIKEGMNIFEIVRVVGIPYDSSVSNGIESLAFKISDTESKSICIEKNDDEIYVAKYVMD